MAAVSHGRGGVNYYNEIDRGACAWLQELIDEGLIPEGKIDDRDIRDVAPSDLKGFNQCHFFAGIGGWSYALRLAGISDDHPVWTGSCPCQPFSCAGQGKGTADERHLWPAFRWLIAQRRPAIVFGEQVAPADGREWLAGVRSDLEAMEYRVGAADLCSACVGSPNIRQRLWWVAHDQRQGLEGYTGNERNRDESGRIGAHAIGSTSESGRVDYSQTIWWPCRDGKWRRVPSGLADSSCDRCKQGRQSIAEAGRDEVERNVTAGRVSNAKDANGRPGECREKERVGSGEKRGRRFAGGCGNLQAAQHGWVDVKSSLFPLAPSIPGRVGMLRGAGNAINPQVAEIFIRASFDVFTNNYANA